VQAELIGTPRKQGGITDYVKLALTPLQVVVGVDGVKGNRKGAAMGKWLVGIALALLWLQLILEWVG